MCIEPSVRIRFCYPDLTIKTYNLHINIGAEDVHNMNIDMMLSEVL